MLLLFACAYEPALNDADHDGWAIGDCDDAAADVHPGAPEACNQRDDDCDGVVDEELPTARQYRDGDGDGWGAGPVVASTCLGTPGYSPRPADCDDADAAVNPGAPELCNDLDDDCDGVADDGIEVPWYVDADGDRYGVEPAVLLSCHNEMPYTRAAGDCDDADAAVNPGAPELCNDLDDDCDGVADDGIEVPWYVDADGDGYGVEPVAFSSCHDQGSYSLLSGDCDDDDASVHPGATEPALCDEVDQDCDGTMNEQARCPGDTGVAMSDVTGTLEFVDGELVAGTVVQRWYPAFDYDFGDADPALARCTASRTLTVGEPRACYGCDWGYTYTLSEPVYEGVGCEPFAVDPERPVADDWFGFSPRFPGTGWYEGDYFPTLVSHYEVWPAPTYMPFYPTTTKGDPSTGVTFFQPAFWDWGTRFTW